MDNQDTLRFGANVCFRQWKSSLQVLTSDSEGTMVKIDRSFVERMVSNAISADAAWESSRVVTRELSSRSTIGIGGRMRCQMTLSRP